MPDVQPSRSELGAFYTPTHVVNYMVDQIRSALVPAATALEPSGGDGAFVRGLVAAGMAATAITVLDINAACRAPIEATGAVFHHVDALLGGHCGSYDVVIGNPPYLNKQSTYIKANKRALAARWAAVGANDTYAMFIALGLERLKAGGTLSLLVSDTFLTLGIHRKLRELLVATTTINAITLLPADTFPDAAVNTAVLTVTKTPPPAGHQVRFRDARHTQLDSAVDHYVSQRELADNPGTLFAFGAARRYLALVRNSSRLLDLVDGGLGMHTGDNARYLAPRPTDGNAWRPYHKTGGRRRWWRPAEHHVRWDDESRRHYGIPASALAGVDAEGNPRPGFVVSGIADQLCAGMATPMALWDSNKVFAMFPKDPEKWPPEFFVALLNSAVYNGIAQALNHTVSLQVRDLKLLPLLEFTEHERSQLTDAGRRAVQASKVGGTTEELDRAQSEIDRIVQRAANRLWASASQPGA